MALGDAQWRQGRLTDAAESYRRSLALREGMTDPHPMDLATCHKHLAIIALEVNDPEAALRELDSARDLLTAAYEPDHPDVADVDNHRGEALRRLGRAEEAHEALSSALRVRSRLGDHPDVVGTLIRLGALLRDTGQIQESYTTLTEARRMAAAAMGENHPYVADALCALADTLTVMGQDTEAAGVLTEAWRRYREAYGDAHALTRQTRDRLDGLGEAPGTPS